MAGKEKKKKIENKKKEEEEGKRENEKERDDDDDAKRQKANGVGILLEVLLAKPLSLFTEDCSDDIIRRLAGRWVGRGSTFNPRRE